MQKIRYVNTIARVILNKIDVSSHSNFSSKKLSIRYFKVTCITILVHQGSFNIQVKNNHYMQKKQKTWNQHSDNFLKEIP